MIAITVILTTCTMGLLIAYDAWHCRDRND